MFGCDTHLLKHIKQAILAWSFRQNIFLGCFPVFPAISAPDEFIVNRSQATSCLVYVKLKIHFIWAGVELGKRGSQIGFDYRYQLGSPAAVLVQITRYSASVVHFASFPCWFWLIFVYFAYTAMVNWSRNLSSYSISDGTHERHYQGQRGSPWQTVWSQAGIVRAGWARQRGWNIVTGRVFSDDDRATLRTVARQSIRNQAHCSPSLTTLAGPRNPAFSSDATNFKNLC